MRYRGSQAYLRSTSVRTEISMVAVCSKPQVCHPTRGLKAVPPLDPVPALLDSVSTATGGAPWAQ